MNRFFKSQVKLSTQFIRRHSSNSLVKIEPHPQNDKIALVKMSSPPVNSMSKQFCEDLISCIDTLENDDSVRTMVLTSSKPGIFSAGLDITEFYQRDEAHVRDFWATVLEMHYRLYSAGLVTIAAMNGTSPAGGVVLALSCDYRVMVDNPKFRMGLNETQLGLCPPEWLSRLQIDAMGQVAGERSIFLGRMLIVF